MNFFDKENWYVVVEDAFLLTDDVKQNTKLIICPNKRIYGLICRNVG